MKNWVLGWMGLWALLGGIHSFALAEGPGDPDDANDASNPALEVKDPNWFDNNISVMNPPNKLTVEQQQACTVKILEYINDTFHTEFTPKDVMPVQLSGWKKPEMGFVRGGGFNIRVVGRQPTVDPKTVHYGRYMPTIGWIELGAHAALHLPGSIDGFQTFTRKTAPGFHGKSL